jgi:hypothetical protein
MTNRTKWIWGVVGSIVLLGVTVFIVNPPNTIVKNLSGTSSVTGAESNASLAGGGANGLLPGGMNNAPVGEQSEEDAMRESEAMFLSAAQEQLEEMRQVPGAAPLVDDIINYLKNDRTGDFSFDELPVDDEGMIELTEETMDHVIKNEEVRAKWKKLMKLLGDYEGSVDASNPAGHEVAPPAPKNE